jgi:excisionase family DNA binding protein
MPTSAKRKRATAPARSPEVLDVRGVAALLTVSADTVYDLFAKGELPGRKVGRKWLTTKAAVLRWIAHPGADGLESIHLETILRQLDSNDASTAQTVRERRGALSDG